MEYTQEMIDRYYLALTDLKVYNDLFEEVYKQEGWEREHTWRIVEKRLHYITGVYRFKSYQSFRSSVYIKGIK